MAKKEVSKVPQKKPLVINKKKIAPKPSNNKLWLLALLGLVIFTYVLYTPALKNSLTTWDDKDYIENNPSIYNCLQRDVEQNEIENIGVDFCVGKFNPGY